jgi:hypothetical protein
MSIWLASTRASEVNSGGESDSSARSRRSVSPRRAVRTPAIQRDTVEAFTLYMVPICSRVRPPAICRRSSARSRAPRSSTARAKARSKDSR